MASPSVAAAAAGEPSADSCSSSSILVRFYRDGQVDSFGRSLEEILRYSDLELEMCHNHIQWLFPLHEESVYSDPSDHQVLTPKDALEFKSSPVALEHVRGSVARFRLFLGLPLSSSPGDSSSPPAPDDVKISRWCHDYNHNLLRITRIIRSLRLLGMDEEAAGFHRDAVAAVARMGAADAGRRGVDPVPERTLGFWSRALEGDPWSQLNGRPKKEATKDQPAGCKQQ